MTKINFPETYFFRGSILLLLFGLISCGSGDGAANGESSSSSDGSPITVREYEEYLDRQSISQPENWKHLTPEDLAVVPNARLNSLGECKVLGIAEVVALYDSDDRHAQISKQGYRIRSMFDPDKEIEGYGDLSGNTIIKYTGCRVNLSSGREQKNDHLNHLSASRGQSNYVVYENMSEDYVVRNALLKELTASAASLYQPTEKSFVFKRDDNTYVSVRKGNGALLSVKVADKMPER